MNLKYRIHSKKNIANIYIRLYYGRTLDISRATGLVIKKEHWDTKNQKIRNLAEIKNRNQINSKLLELKSAILSDYNNDYMLGEVIDGSWLESKIKTFFNRPKGEDDKETRNRNLYLTKYASWWLKEIAPTRKVSANKVMSPKTITHYNKAMVLLQEFEGKNKIKFNTITGSTLNSFADFLTDTKSYATATAKRMVTRIKFFCERAEEDNITVNKNYKKQVFVAEEEVDYIKPYLNEEEINRIFNLDLSHDNTLDNVRDNFIIGLWTGLRVGDFLKRLNISNIKDGYIEIKTQKTNTKVVIPIHPQVQSVLNKRAGFMPTKINEPDFNKKIKIICQLCDIDQEMIGGLMKVDPKSGIKRKVIGTYKKYQLISSHTCRASFATNFIGKIPNQDIIQILGWSSEAMLNKYNKTTNKESADKLKAVWNKDN